MARFLLVYATTEGHTHKVAHYILKKIRQAGHEIELADAAELDISIPTANYDAFILGGSVHQEGHQLSLRNFVRDHVRELNHHPSAFFSVSLNAALNDAWHHQEAQTYVNQFLEDTGWQANLTWLVAGALKNTQYDYFKKQLLHFVKERTVGQVGSEDNYEFTDWDDVDRFVESFIAKVQASTAN